MKPGDAVTDGEARGTVLRVERYRHTDGHMKEDLYIQWDVPTGDEEEPR